MFKVGGYIDGPRVSGTIKEIQIFHTILSTLDNRMIYVPNGSLSGNAGVFCMTSMKLSILHSMKKA